MAELRGKKVLVVGLGKSGVAAAKLCAREGAVVTGSDRRGGAELGEEAVKLASLGVRLELGGHRAQSFTGADLIVKSPGVPPSLPELVAARMAGVQTVGEVELCVPWLARPVVGITGTNGKSTTTALTGHLLAAAGIRAFVGGNLGTPVAQQVLYGAGVEATVLELSSYQVDDLDSFRCDVAAVLNVTPDHLARYGAMESYAASKARLFELLAPSGVAIVNADNALTAPMRARTGGRTARFGHGRREELSLFDEDGVVIRRAPDGSLERYTVGAKALRGAHNLENAMAAIEAARVVGAAPEAIQRGLDSYPGLPHRLELVRVLDEVEWVNDSKGTNVDAVEKSLAAFAGPVHLIMGGRGKGAPYAPLRPLFERRVTRLYLIGEDAPQIEKELGELAPVERAGELATAVLLARGFARPGETVLFSPACASFDQFTSFEERGEAFRQVVQRLAEGA